MTPTTTAVILYGFLKSRSHQPLTAKELAALDEFKTRSPKSIKAELDRLHAGGKIKRSRDRPYAYWWDETCFMPPIVPTNYSRVA